MQSDLCAYYLKLKDSLAVQRHFLHCTTNKEKSNKLRRKFKHC